MLNFGAVWGIDVGDSALKAVKLKLVGKSIRPDESETSANPRARSAHLRVAERLDEGIAA